MSSRSCQLNLCFRRYKHVKFPDKPFLSENNTARLGQRGATASTHAAMLIIKTHEQVHEKTSVSSENDGFSFVDHNLTIVEEFVCMNDPRGCVVRAVYPSRISQGWLVPGDISDKEQFTILNRKQQGVQCPSSWTWAIGAPMWSLVWRRGSSTSAWWLDQNEYMVKQRHYF